MRPFPYYSFITRSLKFIVKLLKFVTILTLLFQIVYAPAITTYARGATLLSYSYLPSSYAYFLIADRMAISYQTSDTTLLAAALSSLFLIWNPKTTLYNLLEPSVRILITWFMTAWQQQLCVFAKSTLFAKSAAYVTLYLCLKCLFVFLLVVLVRVTVPKYKMETISKLGWLYPLFVILTMLALITLGVYCAA